MTLTINRDLDLEDLKANIEAALLASPIHGLREIEVDQMDDSILISGTVESFYHKQLAQELVRHISPETKVVNSVSVEEC